MNSANDLIYVSETTAWDL